MELAPRNKEFCKNEFPSMKMCLFDAEFNSESNGDIFIHGKTIRKKFPLICILLLYVYMCHHMTFGTQFLCAEQIPVLENESIRCRIKFCIEWWYFYSRENDLENFIRIFLLYIYTYRRKIKTEISFLLIVFP